MDLLEDPNQVGLLSLGLRLMSTPGKFGTALGQSGLGAMSDMQQAKAAQQAARTRALQEQQMMMQLEELKRAQAEKQKQAERQQAIEGAFRNSFESPATQALAAGGGPTVGNAQAMQGMQPRVNQQKLIAELMQADPVSAYKMSIPSPEETKVVGDALVSIGPGGAKELYRAPQKPDKGPTSVQEYQYGKNDPAYLEWLDRQNKNKGTNIGMPKIEVKMGESVAGQIGPMAKDSRIQAQGAVGMFDSANRIQAALDSGKVSAGPFTTQVNTVKQLVQKVSGGNDEGIRQTRQVIKSLAQMSVEARKELQGQGQVTESEAAAVAKAESGDINDLTTGELQDLVTLTKRAAHFRAKSHQNLLESLSGSEATRGMVPFYKVQNMDALLNHSPQLPQIGTGNAVDAALKKYGVGK